MSLPEHAPIITIRYGKHCGPLDLNGFLRGDSCIDRFQLLYTLLFIEQIESQGVAFECLDRWRLREWMEYWINSPNAHGAMQHLPLGLLQMGFSPLQVPDARQILWV